MAKSRRLGMRDQSLRKACSSTPKVFRARFDERTVHSRENLEGISSLCELVVEPLLDRFDSWQPVSSQQLDDVGGRNNYNGMSVFLNFFVRLRIHKAGGDKNTE